MLLTVMSIEKLFALYFPLKAKSYCTVGTAKWMTSILALAFVGLNVPILVWYKAIGQYCYVTNHVDYFVMLNLLFYAFVPCYLPMLQSYAN